LSPSRRAVLHASIPMTTLRMSRTWRPVMAFIGPRGRLIGATAGSHSIAPVIGRGPWAVAPYRETLGV